MIIITLCFAFMRDFFSSKQTSGVRKQAPEIKKKKPTRDKRGNAEIASR